MINPNELNYYIVNVEDREEAVMFDSLLTRVFGTEAFNIFRKKGETLWRFKFWATADEYADIRAAMYRVLEPDWDADYEKLVKDV